MSQYPEVVELDGAHVYDLVKTQEGRDKMLDAGFSPMCVSVVQMDADVLDMISKGFSSNTEYLMK